MKRFVLQFSFLMVGLISVLSMQYACTGGTDGNDAGNTPEATNTDKGAPGCQRHSECKISEICNRTEGKCSEIKCNNNNDCRGGWKCVKDKCYDPAKAPCQADTDCTDSKLWKCDTSSGKCEDGGCRKDEDCKEPKLPTCDTTTNKCKKKACRTDGDCNEDPNKPICDKNTGVCGTDQGLGLGEDCSTKVCLRELQCVDDDGKKVCTKACDPYESSNKCRTGKVCIRQGNTTKGLCLSPGTGLKEGEDCGSGKTCQKHLRCAFDGAKELCRRPCIEDKNCDELSERCVTYGSDKLCMPKPQPCGPGRSCPGEAAGSQVCNQGQCEIVLCPKQRKCPPEAKCKPSGRCIPRQCPTDKCDPLFKCSNGRCVRTNEGSRCGPGQAIKADECGNGLICTRIGYLYACAKPCTSGGCETGFTCKTNADNKQVCMQGCDISNQQKKCKYPNYFCMNMKRAPKGSHCVPVGQPTGKDIMEKCDASNACLPDLQCYRGFSARTGYCVLRGCKSNADCGGVQGAVCATYYDLGKACYYKCPNQTFGTCSFNGVNGRCYRQSGNPYICRPF